MKKTKLEQWICETEGLPELTWEALEYLQLQKLNAMLERMHQRDGRYPARVETLAELGKLPFTTPEIFTISESTE